MKLSGLSLQEKIIEIPQGKSEWVSIFYTILEISVFSNLLINTKNRKLSISRREVKILTRGMKQNL